MSRGANRWEGAGQTREERAQALQKHLCARWWVVTRQGGNLRCLAIPEQTPEPLSDAEKAALRDFKPELLCLLSSPRPTANAGPGASPRPTSPIPHDTQERIRNLASQLRTAPDDSICTTFADTLADLFARWDKDPGQSRSTYLGWARKVRSNQWDQAILIDAFAEGCQPGTDNPGRRMAGALKKAT